jgi:hypothetical protein
MDEPKYPPTKNVEENSTVNDASMWIAITLLLIYPRITNIRQKRRDISEVRRYNRWQGISPLEVGGGSISMCVLFTRTLIGG